MHACLVWKYKRRLAKQINPSDSFKKLSFGYDLLLSATVAMHSSCGPGCFLHCFCVFIGASAAKPHMDDTSAIFHILYIIYYWASEASPTWVIHLGFSYIIIIVRTSGIVWPPFFFLRRGVCVWNIVALLGVSVRPMCLVIEYASLGSLFGILDKKLDSIKTAQAELAFSIPRMPGGVLGQELSTRIAVLVAQRRHVGSRQSSRSVGLQ